MYYYFYILIIGTVLMFGIFLIQKKIVSKNEKQKKIVADLKSALEKKNQEYSKLRQELTVSLNKEKNKVSSIINNFTDGLLFFNGENKLNLINYKAEIFLEVIGEKVAGKTLSEIDNSLSFEKLKRLLKEGKGSLFRKELYLKENLIIEVSTLSVFGEASEEGVLITLHDITREKALEKTKSEFISLAAHRLRTPLSAIKWTLRMFLDEEFGQLNKAQKKFMERTYNSNERMINLVNDVLEVIRIEEGRIIYKPSLADMGKIIQTVLDSYKKTIQRKKIKLIFKEPKGEIPPLLIDVEKIKIAFQNLLDNAIKYSRTGDEVTVSLEVGIKEVEVSLKDKGVGIPEDQQHRVFTKFFRGANVMRMETEGTGLGLFIARNIIEAHEGKIWFVSKENKGSVFSFALPIREKGDNFPKNNHSANGT